MVAFCDQGDVEQRLRRELTTDEVTGLPGMIEEAQTLVLSYLGCPPEKYEDEVPAAITLVTSRMVARVIQEDEVIDPATFGATQTSATAGPFSHQATYQAGSRTGAPWLTRVDKSALDAYRCAGKAFAVDTAPSLYSAHRDVCTSRWWGGDLTYCTCGLDIAGKPIYEG